MENQDLDLHKVGLTSHLGGGEAIHNVSAFTIGNTMVTYGKSRNVVNGGGGG